MIKFMTKDYVKQEAAKGEMASLECSKKHHWQGWNCSRGELIDAIERHEFEVHSEFCACCVSCEVACIKCILGDGKSQFATQCCGGAWNNVRGPFGIFKINPTPANFAAFQTAEKAVCDYIQAVIDKKKEGEVDYSKPIVATKNGEMYLLVPTRRPESYEIVGYDWLNLKTGQANSCSCWKTQRKAIDCYSDHVIKNVDLAIIEDNAKQAKVGEKSEQGKSEEKVKDEPKLGHLDYGLNDSGEICVMGNPWNEDKLVQMDRNCIHSASATGPTTIIKTKLGNLIDDLTKTSAGFEMENGGGYGPLKAETGNSMDNGVRIHHGQHCIVIGASVLAEFHRKLGHVLNGIRSKT